MKSDKRQLKRRRLIWIWVLVISMLTPVLPGQQSAVHASGAAQGWKTVGAEGFSLL